MWDNFPYTDLHNLNLDWIITEVKKVSESSALNTAQIAVLNSAADRLEKIVDYNAPLIAQILDELNKNGIHIETQPSFITVGKRGCMYTSINDAVSAARTYCSTNNRVAIQIYPGVYTESINLAPNPGIDLIGIGDVTIIKPTETTYPNMCLFTAGQGTFSGLTFKNNDANAPYCVHYEVQGLEDSCRYTKCEFINCTFYNTATGTGIGAGGGCSDTLRFINCTFRSISGVSAYFHNHPVNSEQFELTLKNCYFESVANYAMTVDCYKKGYFIIIANGNAYYPEGKTLTLNTLSALGATPSVTHYVPSDSYIVFRGCGGNATRCLDTKPVYISITGVMDTTNGYVYQFDNIKRDSVIVQSDTSYTITLNQTNINLKSATAGAFTTTMLVGFI